MKTKYIYVFYGLLIVVCFFYFSKTVYQLYSYYRLDKKKSCQIIQWSIKQTHRGKFLVIAKYSFDVNGNTVTGKMTFSDKPFLNKPTAIFQIKKWDKQNWQVSYDSKKPTVSSLANQVPIKNISYMFISMGVLIYFIILLRKINNQA